MTTTKQKIYHIFFTCSEPSSYACDADPLLNQHWVNASCSQAGLYYSPRARGVLFVLEGPYDPRVPPIVKFSQESESARLTKIIMSKPQFEILRMK